METIYLETQCGDHPRAQRIINQFPKAQIIECDHYGEVFNPKSQNFRLQKQKPALIIAKKRNQWVLPTPEGFGIGGEQNYYFSHMLNCVYDCRYCFLQGMYPSANYVLFINYEDFMAEIRTVAKNHKKPVYFFSGYDGDSLAYEPVSHFLEAFLPFFAGQPNAILEIRSKSTNIKPLLQHPVIKNCVVAFSFTPAAISAIVEHKVPSLEKRIAALAQLASRGWPIGLRFDPLIFVSDFQKQYTDLIQGLFSAISPSCIHSVSVGPMRFPAKMYAKLIKLYPRDKLLAHPLEKRDGYFTYEKTLEDQLKQWVMKQLEGYLPTALLFECRTS